MFGGSGRFPVERSARSQRVSTAPTWKENIAFAEAQSPIVVVFSVFFLFVFVAGSKKKTARAVLCAGGRDVPQRQWVSTATAVLTEWEWPLHPLPLQLLLGAVAAAVN